VARYCHQEKMLASLPYRSTVKLSTPDVDFSAQIAQYLPDRPDLSYSLRSQHHNKTLMKDF